MKLNKVRYIISYYIIFALSVNAQTLWNGTGHIPSDYQETWNVAGLLQDMSTTTPKQVISINPGAASSQVTSAINSARSYYSSTGGLTIIYFPQGTYTFTSTIQLTHNDQNIVFQGDGSDKTTFVFQNIPDDHCIKISGTAVDFSSGSDLDQNFDKGDNILHAATGAGLSAISTDDWVHFVQFNFDYNDDDPEHELIEDIVGQITQIESMGTDASGEWAEIKDEANMDYVDSPNTDYSLRIRKFEPVMNIGIEDLKITRDPNTADPTDDSFCYNIFFNFAVNCWVRGVESYKPSRSHLHAARSSHLEISGCYFHEAMGYGGGGWGYGISLGESTTNCLVVNNIFRHLRHSLIGSGGSNCDVWAFNYSCEQHSTYWLGIGYDDRDLDLHAKYPFGHLFEHNIVCAIATDDHFGDNGPYNAFVRNLSTEHNAMFKTLDDWSILGNMKLTDDYLYPLQIDWDENPVLDIYGLLTSYTVPVAHNVAYNFGAYSSYRLDDVSYYYSSAPDFLSGYSWPAIGPETTTGGSVGYSIPAEDRFNATKKTYLPDPTPRPVTSSGTLTYNEIWQGSHTLTGNVTVPAGITLTVASGTTVQIPAGCRITVQGTLIADGATFTRSGGSNWWGLYFDSANSACLLNDCTIEYANNGAYCNSSAPTISYCSFENNGIGINCNSSTSGHDIHGNYFENNSSCAIRVDQSGASVWENTIEDGLYYGIYCSDSYGTNKPRFYNNTICDITNRGIYMSNSDAVIVQNNIYDTNDALSLYSYCYPEFQDYDDEPGHNVFINNDRYGIYIDDDAEV